MFITDAEKAQRQATRARFEFHRFKELIANPGNLATGVELPGSANLHVSTSLTTAAAAVITEDGARDLGIKAAPAGTRHAVGWFTVGSTITKKAGYAGTVRLYVRNRLGSLFLIAQG